MTDLSPAAQAVLDAAYALPLKNGQPNIAAALRAAVEQCACKREVHPDSLLTESVIESDDLLAIATELENAND